MQINKAEQQQPVTIEDIQDGKALIDETQSESNATYQVNHLTTNLSESSGFGDGPITTKNTYKSAVAGVN